MIADGLSLGINVSILALFHAFLYPLRDIRYEAGARLWGTHEREKTLFDGVIVTVRSRMSYMCRL